MLGASNRQFQQMLQTPTLEHEDRLALCLNFVYVSLLYHSVFLSPALKHLFAAEKNYQQQIENHVWMLEQQPIVKEMLAIKPAVREGSLLSIASATAKQFDITFNRFEPVGDDKVRLRLDQVEFNALVSWLGVLESDKVVAVDISLIRQVQVMSCALNHSRLRLSYNIFGSLYQDFLVFMKTFFNRA